MNRDQVDAALDPLLPVVQNALHEVPHDAMASTMMFSRWLEAPDPDCLTKFSGSAFDANPSIEVVTNAALFSLVRDLLRLANAREGTPAVFSCFLQWFADRFEPAEVASPPDWWGTQPLPITPLGGSVRRAEVKGLWTELHTHGQVPWPTKPGTAFAPNSLHETIPPHPDKDQVAAMRAWQPSRGAPIPERFHPGDVATIRFGLHATCEQLCQADENPPWAFTHSDGLLRSSVPFFVPAELAPMLEAQPSDAVDIPMPHDQMFVMFGQPFDIGADATGSTLFGPLPVAGIDNDWDASMWALGEAAHPPIRRLVGVVLIAAPGTRQPRDVVGWVVATHAGQNRLVEMSSNVLVLPGRLSQSRLNGLVANALTVVNYASLHEPGPVDLPEQDKARKKALKTSKVRKQMRDGQGIDRLQVADVARTAARTASPVGPNPTEGQGTGTSRRPHYRRGHWRRVVCGPRDDSWHELRFIGPTIVASDSAEVSPAHRVLRVPLDAFADESESEVA